MSAIVCGKRAFFDELPSTSPSVSKRIRCSSSSPVCFSPPRSSSSSSYFFSSSSAIDHLVALFPNMDRQILERALEECGSDLDSAVKSLSELCLVSADKNLGSSLGDSQAALETIVQVHSQGIIAHHRVTGAVEDSSSANLPHDGADWVELFVQEILSASTTDDARARASRALKVFEKSIRARADAEAAQENTMLKEQIEALVQENSILKRAVSIQHERQKEYDDTNQELQHLKQLVSQYQEQLRTLEVNNYALSMHLRQAQQGNSIPGRLHPDVF
ncbi:Ubiquitin system component CUE [Dillenia turbinata]|uniref:Ubiquitin system component CUE n=1 Tax=Dillenia turbinata TaxID=194707 RepID=A0AAN8ZPR0_9MAGN